MITGTHIVVYIETYLLQNQRVRVEDLEFIKDGDEFEVKHGDKTIFVGKTHLQLHVMKRRVLREMNRRGLWTPSSKDQQKYRSKKPRTLGQPYPVFKVEG